MRKPNKQEKQLILDHYNAIRWTINEKNFYTDIDIQIVYKLRKGIVLGMLLLLDAKRQERGAEPSLKYEEIAKHISVEIAEFFCVEQYKIGDIDYKLQLNKG